MPDESGPRAPGAAVAARRRRTDQVIVRRAATRDLEDVVALRLALLHEESRNPFFANPHPDAARRALRLTREEMSAPGQVFLIALRDGETVGLLRCREVRRTPLVADARQAVVTTVYVVPSQRKTGVLRALLEGANRWCRQHRIGAMRLQCAIGNSVGRKAWESLGFEPAELVYLRGVPAV